MLARVRFQQARIEQAADPSPLPAKVSTVHMQKMVLASVAVVATLGIAASATAQVYPSRPITIIVPFGAGGPSDTLTRILAEHMRASLGQPVIVENMGGAAGRIGTGRVAHAAPDGYTLGHGSAGTHMANGAVYPLNYDLLKDFEPVSLLASTPQLIVAKKTMPANNLQELIAWLKANPEALQGTSGIGGYSHLAGLYFQKQTGTRFGFLPNRGPALNDLLAGHVDLMIDQTFNALPHVRNGNIKSYAVASKTRLAEAPDIPTVDEAGLPGFHFSHWYAFFVPKGTPKTIIDTLNAATVQALADPVVRRRLTDLGLEFFPREQQTPEALAAYHKADIEKWWPIIKAAGIRAE
jgi:tripartite-type tricarboxylate transporter receptor subunit TctC